MKRPIRRARGAVWLLTVAAVIAAVLTATTSAQPVAAAHEPSPITVTITEITHIGGDIDPGLFQGPVGDFYAGVTIDGVTQDTFDQRFNFPLEFGTGFIFPFTLRPSPFWVLSRTVSDHAPTSAVSIEIWDNDDCDTPFCDDTGIFGNNDDQVDASPSGSETLTLTVDRDTGRWSGDVSWPQNCATGTGGEAVRVCFDISVASTSGDADGDSLLDSWETDGINLDGDGTIDLDLPALGADPNQADIFVEIDCMVTDGDSDGDLTDLGDHSQCPRLDALQLVAQSFADAPITNPDGTTGIRLHLDTGTLYGPGTTTVAGTGGVSSVIGDLGGGNQVPESTVVSWDGSGGSANFYTIKAANFDGQRAFAFRYALFANQVNARQANFDCTSGWAELPGNDVIVSLGGRRDVDGNGTGDRPCWGAGPPNGIDDDGDGAIDEDLPNAGIDDDGDLLIDEDPFDGIDNDGDGLVDEDGFARDDDGDCIADTDGDGLLCDSGDAGVDEDHGFSLGSRNQQAGTFMHELGHNLNFQHGGGDGVNDKPNYLSVMNYSFQGCGVPSSPASAAFPIPGGCDFSRIDVDLDERPAPGLDECFGVGPQLGLGSMDWDGSGMITPPPTPPPPVFTGATCAPVSANVSADINSDANLGALGGFNDWANILFAFRDTDDFADGDSGSHPLEADPEAIERSLQALPEVGHDLELTADGADRALPGDTIPISFETTNAGGGPSFGTTLAITDPEGTTEDRPQALLVAGAGVVELAEVEVPVPTPNGTVLIVGAATTGVDLYGRPEVDRTDNLATHEITIDAPELSLTKDGPATAEAGASMTFDLAVTNDGGADAIDVVLTDTLPAGLVYNPADDTGAGPVPDDVAVNGDGTTTLRWEIGTLAPGAEATVQFTVRSSLLTDGGSSLLNSASASYVDANANMYPAAEANVSVLVDSGPESQDPLKWSTWRGDEDSWTAELRARIQATDTRFDGADGSTPDGVLSSSEVDAVLSVGQRQPDGLTAQLLATYLNLADGRIHAATVVDSRKADDAGVATVAGAARAAAEALASPVTSSTRKTYTSLTQVLDEVNKNKSEVYGQ